MATSRAPSMTKKAANEGDKLKHALVLEVLGRCGDWDSLNYAETHAGAGLYFASNQDENKPHIAKLCRSVSSVKIDPREEEPGGRYYHLLRDWWSDKTCDTYPGSVLQSARYLHRKNVTPQFRVTEAHDDSYTQLDEAVKGYGIHPKHEKFQSKIAWLTENDSLVLLLDPFAFNEDFGEAREESLNKGRMDLPTLEMLLEACWSKEGAVVLLWCAFPHKAGQLQKGIAYGSLRCMCKTHKAALRCFHYSSYYSTFIVGIGKGVDVVTDLPKHDAWSRSWLSKTVYCGL